MCNASFERQTHSLHNAVALDAMQASRNLCADMGDVDPNLLPALDASLTEGSATGAARRLVLSASAMSRTLRGCDRCLATRSWSVRAAGW